MEPVKVGMHVMIDDCNALADGMRGEVIEVRPDGSSMILVHIVEILGPSSYKKLKYLEHENGASGWVTEEGYSV